MVIEVRNYFTQNNAKSVRYRRVLTIVLLLSLSSYLVYQMMSGDRGFLALFKLSEKHRVLEKNINNLDDQKQSFEKKVYMLKPESLNLDLLDEQVRRRLGYSKDGETVYMGE